MAVERLYWWVFILDVVLVMLEVGDRLSYTCSMCDHREW